MALLPEGLQDSLTFTLLYVRTRLHKLFRKATRVIPENVYNDDLSYTNIWVCFALAERYVVVRAGVNAQMEPSLTFIITGLYGAVP